MFSRLSATIKVLLILLVVIQLSVFVGYFYSNHLVKKEYYYIDQKTKLADGSIVSNKEFEDNYLHLNEIGDDYVIKPSVLNVYISQKWEVNTKPKFKYTHSQFMLMFRRQIVSLTGFLKVKIGFWQSIQMCTVKFSTRIQNYLIFHTNIA